MREPTVSKMHVRGATLTVTIPEELQEEIAAHNGDEIEMRREEDGRVVLTPKEELAERHPEIGVALEEGMADVREGRVSPAFKSMAEFKAWRKTPEGKKFSAA